MQTSEAQVFISNIFHLFLSQAHCKPIQGPLFQIREVAFLLLSHVARCTIFLPAVELLWNKVRLEHLDS